VSDSHFDRTSGLGMGRNNKKEQPEVWQVKQILDMEILKNGKRKFKVKWMSIPGGDHYSDDEHDSWEPEDGVFCSELIAQFMENREK
ncbi:hypothetical protein PENTCL1PPCAC_17456, partial [Pristionchus entomophagus]